MPLPTDEVTRALHFSLEDLALNQAGKLSSRQLFDSTKSAALIVVFTLVVAGLLVLVLTMPGVRRAPRVLLGLFASAGLMVCAYLSWQSLADLVAPKVASIEGPIEFVSVGRGAGIKIGKQIIGTPPCSDVLVSGASYRVYYRAASGGFLSLEPIDERSESSPGAERKPRGP